MEKKQQKKILNTLISLISLISVIACPLSIILPLEVYSQSKVIKIKQQKIDLSIGIDKTILLSYVPDTRAQIGNENILTVDFVPVKKQIILKGLKVGKSSLTIRNTIGEIKSQFIITISKSSYSEEIKTLKEALADIEGITIGLKGNQVYVGGLIVVPNDIGKVSLILAKYPDVLPLYEFDPKTRQIIAEQMQKEIINNNMPNVRVRVLNDVFFMEGQVSSNAEKMRAEEILQIFIPDKLESLSRRTGSVQHTPKPIYKNFIIVNAKSKPKPMPKMLKITSQFVELSKDYQKIFGFKWQPLLSSGGGTISIGQKANGTVGTSSNGTLASTISNLFPKLASAKAAGYARVIQSGTIVMKNNVTGKIEKSENTPLALGTGNFTKVSNATSGFNLGITPKILQNENIEMKIGLEVGATSTVGVDGSGNPIIKELKNKVSTIIIVKSKKTAVVGGIVINKSNTSYDKDPPGSSGTASPGSSPLFNFVRSKAYTSTKSQFVVFITPEIIKSASDGTEKIKMKFKRRGR